MYTDAEGMKEHPSPREMNERDIETAIQEFVDSAKKAINAGFDGVEIHGANGYLIDQFLNTASNRRTDSWGKTVEGRTKFAIATAGRVAAAVGAEHVGIRLSPAGGFNGMSTDEDRNDLYLTLTDALSDIGLAYIHLVDHSAMGAPKLDVKLARGIRERFLGALILAGGYDAGRGEADLQENACDLVAFARPFIANPDLVRKLKAGAELLSPDPTTFYTPGEKGYTDY
jgi:N-ethylmaleimide reductase